MKVFRALIFGACTVLAPRLVAAQAQSSGDTLPSALARLRVGQTVLVRTSDGRRTQDALANVRLTPAALTLRNLPDPIPAAAIDSLWLRQSSVVSGAVTGGLLLGITAWGFWWWFCNAISETGPCRDYGAVTLLALPEAAVGAAIGAWIGSRQFHWTLRYVR